MIDAFVLSVTTAIVFIVIALLGFVKIKLAVSLFNDADSNLDVFMAFVYSILMGSIYISSVGLLVFYSIKIFGI